jgi:UDP-glucose 4-epimerase
MVDLLVEQGYRVHIIDSLAGGRLANIDHHKANSDVVFEKKDISALSANDVLFRGATYVFHFAGIADIVPSIDHPTQYVQTNVLGTVHVLEAARQAGVRKLVYAASSSCYGIADELPTTENATIQPQYPYALSKYMGEEAVLHWGHVYRLPVNSLRIFNAYGMRSRTTGAYGAVFGVFLAQKLARKPFTVVGDGSQTRDFLYVTDVVRAFYAAAVTDRVHRVYNVGAGKPQSVNTLVKLLGGECIHLPKRPGEPDCTWADVSRIRQELKWEPQVSFEQGVNRMLENIDYWREAPVWDVPSIEAATKNWFAFLTAKDSKS